MRYDLSVGGGRAGYPAGDPVQRFWSRVDRSGDCWLWTGARTQSGYGWFFLSKVPTKRTALTHRLSYQLAFGEIPDGMKVLHRCDVRLCVRPEHLFAGTIRDNAIDMMQKGRGRNKIFPGETNHRARLTDDLVREIRRRHAAGVSLHQLGRDFDYHWVNIRKIVRRTAWKHVE